FLLMGGSLGWGMWIVVNNYLLAHVAEDERPLFVALINLLFAPSALYPVIGGLFVRKESFVMVAGMPPLFVLTATVVAVGFLLALRLPNPEPDDEGKGKREQGKGGKIQNPKSKIQNLPPDPERERV